MPRYNFNEEFEKQCKAAGCKEFKRKEINEMDIKLKDLKSKLNTRQPIRITWKDTGESIIADLGCFDRYADYYVTCIYACNGELCIDIQAQI